MSSQAAPSRSTSPNVAQYDVTELRSTAMTGAQKLLVAVVRRAVSDFVLHTNSDKAEMRGHAEDARRWLLTDDGDDLDEDGRYSFSYACEMLGLDLGTVRARLTRLRPEDIRRLESKLKDT